MGKKIIATISVVILITCLLFLAKVFFPAKEIVLDQTNATFVVKGNVQVKKSGAHAEWQPMSTATILEKGDAVKTAGDSSADIIIGNDNEKVVRIDKNSSVEFAGINPSSLALFQGKLQVSIKKLGPKSAFVVKTPTAICGARGTAWSQEVGQNSTKLCVFESNVFINKLDKSGKPERKEYMAGELTERVIAQGEPIGAAQPIRDSDLQAWKNLNKTVTYLRDGKVLVSDFNRKENFNNLRGDFGSWNTFYSDPNQYCKDEIVETERAGGGGYCLKLSYDVDTPFSAYNGFFTKLMGINLPGYKYLVFYIKGDEKTGYTTKIKLELKNKLLTGRVTVEGITDQWQKMVVPLDSFAGINNFKDMQELVLVFSDIGVTKKEGVIYIDDIYFSKDEKAPGA